MTQFGDYQNEIYFNGLSGVLPKFPVDFATLEQRASTALAPAVLNYLQGVEIPTEAGRGFRFEAGHHSDLIPATWRGISGVFGWVSNSCIWCLLINHGEGWMPANRELTMRQMRYTLRLASEGVSAREIARMLGVARSTVQDNVKRAQVAGLAWPLPDELTDAALEATLFARNGAPRGMRRRAEPVWSELVCELKRPGVNLMVLWEEYRAGHPEGYGYSRFCELMREFEKRLSPVMRQDHRAGDKVFVDYSGKKIGITDPTTGAVHEAEIFVAVLGASSFTYAEATWSQTLPDWIGAHVRMFRFFGGVPRLVIPDNLKSGVNKASFYDPEINRSYGRICEYYYSVPHNLIRAQVDTCATARMIEIFFQGKRVAVRERRYGGMRHGTKTEHMPSAHRRYAEWTPERFRNWGASVGANTEGLIIAILASRPHPEQGFRTCIGILRLFKGLEKTRAEEVAARAIAYRAFTYKSIASIITNKLDRITEPAPENQAVMNHDNLRGSGYFH